MATVFPFRQQQQASNNWSRWCRLAFLTITLTWGVCWWWTGSRWAEFETRTTSSRGRRPFWSNNNGSDNVKQKYQQQDQQQQLLHQQQPQRNSPQPKQKKNIQEDGGTSDSTMFDDLDATAKLETGQQGTRPDTTTNQGNDIDNIEIISKLANNVDIIHLPGINNGAKIQIASDLHLEFYGTIDNVPDDIIAKNDDNVPVLALLGDIGLSFTDILKDFLYQQSQRFEYVLFLAGNHEFYNQDTDNPYTVDQQINWLRSVCDEIPNVYFLERQVVELGNTGVRIIGTSLWSHVHDDIWNIAERSMNDYRLSYINVNDNGKNKNRIQKMTAAYTTKWHETSVEWLEQQLHQASNDNKPVIVLTHHTPALTGTSNPKYNDSPLNTCFSTDLSRLVSHPAVKVWACGHTHYNFDHDLLAEGLSQPSTPSQPGDQNDFDVDGVNVKVKPAAVTRLVSNQRGYPRQPKDDYDPNGVIIHIPNTPTR